MNMNIVLKASGDESLRSWLLPIKESWPEPLTVAGGNATLGQLLGISAAPWVSGAAGRRQETVALILAALVAHGLVFWGLTLKPGTVLPEAAVEVPPMTIEFARPWTPPPPVVDELAVKKAPPRLKVQPPPKVEPPPRLEEPAPPAQPEPPAPVPAPVTPPLGRTGYLNNPAPEYPDIALVRGWQGTTVLRVHVLPSGAPSEIQVQQSSGRDVLDKAAVAAVKRWTFVPAKRGSEAIAGWAVVPLEFRLD